MFWFAWFLFLYWFAALGWKYSGLWYSSVEVPSGLGVGYWASGEPRPDNTQIKPYRIHFPQEDLDYLQKKLELSRELIRPLEGVNFEYGINSDYLQEFLDYWKTEYNWTQREAFLNRFPSYLTQIGGLDIHFIYLKPNASQVQNKTVIPLLLVHGYPSSVREFYDLLPLLTTVQDDRDFVFEVVAPSLPGYGFSQPAKKRGLGPPEIAVILAELMSRLGFKTFYYQGGDWGSVIGHCISKLYPQRVLALHSTFCLPGTLSSRVLLGLSVLFPSWLVEEGRVAYYRTTLPREFFMETSYFWVQAAKPDALGVGLNDSPIGLATWLLEKFSTWTSLSNRDLPDGGLRQLDRDALLDNIMIYWLTKSITSSMRYYKTDFMSHSQSWWVWGERLKVPTHCARFHDDPLYFPEFVLKRQYDQLSLSDIDRGGHFAALEVPHLLAADVWDYVGRLRQRSEGEPAAGTPQEEEEVEEKEEDPGRSLQTKSQDEVETSENSTWRNWLRELSTLLLPQSLNKGSKLSQEL